MKKLLIAGLANILLGATSAAFAESAPPFPSSEMEYDRREAMYYQECVELVKKALARKNKDLDVTQFNQTISGLMQGYTEILAQEYTPGEHSKEFITGIMRKDKEVTQQRIDKDRYQCLVDFRNNLAAKYEYLVNKYKPYMKN